MNAIIDHMDAYSRLISLFIQKQFPVKLSGTSSDLLDIITDEYLSTKQNRHGPKPGPEAIVTMRQIISTYIAANRPIPVMVPWGSEKPDGTSIDISELSAFKQMECLFRRVQSHYEPGIEFNLRVEDLSAPHQFFHRADLARQEAAIYTADLVMLSKVLGTSFINVSPDSLHGVTEAQFVNFVDPIVSIMQRHLENLSDPEPIAELLKLGWDRPVSPLMVDHYMSGYQKLYPGMTRKMHYHMLARYLAGGLARKQFGLTGAMKHWDKGYLELYFGTTPPGLDPSRYLRRIHYRTMPLDYTSKHLAPWRSKGYLEVSNDNEVTPKLASMAEQLPYHKHCITLEGNGSMLKLQADYILV